MGRVTVLIANFNYGRYLKKAIESALAQTVKPSAICIVDDCSSDDSWSIICKYCETEQREDLITPTPNGDILIKVGTINDVDILGVRLPITSGPSTARNLGIQFTCQSTDFYQILDADDELLPTKIEELLKPMEDERVGVTYANYFNVNSETGVKILEVKEPYSQLRLFQECIVHSGSMLRTSYLEKVREGNEVYDSKMRVCEDYELWIRLSKVCMFYHVAKPLTNVLVHSQNSTNTVDKEKWSQHWSYINQKHFGGQ